MPQLDFSTFASQVFWLFIAFFTLYIILARVSLPTIREVIQSRQARIAGDIKKAELLKKEAEEAEADFTSALSEAKQKASAMIHKVKEKAALEEAKRNAKLDETFVRQNKESDQRVAQVRKEAKEKLLPVSVDVAQAIVNKVLGVNVERKKVESVVFEVSKNYNME